SQARLARYVPDRVSPSGDSRSLAARRAKMPQISVSAHRPRIADETSQADSAGSIPVTRSHVKAQVGEGFSSLGLERFSGFAAPRAINVPLACGVQCAGQTGLAIVPGPLGVYMGVDRVRDGGIGAAGFVLIDERGAFAIVAHPGHQVAQACATGRR